MTSGDCPDLDEQGLEVGELRAGVPAAGKKAYDSWRTGKGEAMRKATGTGGKKAGTAGASLLSLPNMGKMTAAKLARIGITTKEEFLKRDPYEVFDELREKVDPTLCRCALAGIVGAKRGLPWHKITKDSAKEYEKRHPLHKWGPC